MIDLLVSAIIVSVRLVLPALFFCRDKEVSFIERAGRIVTYGLLLNIVPAVLLGAFGLWTPVLDLAAWFAVCGVSAVFGFKRGSRLRLDIGTFKSVIPVVAAVVIAVMMPVRSEWLAGGWDPGLYQTSAVEISRGSGTAPFSRAVYSDMTIEDRAMFSRNENGHHEIMPGVPVTLNDGLLHHYFFPFTPVFGAWLHRIGGIPMLVRLGTITAFLGILPFLWLLMRLFGSGWKAAIGLSFLLISPMWWYHQAVPASELLQLLILTGGIAEYIYLRERRGGGWWGLCLIAFALALNRFSDPPLLAVMLFIAAVAESGTAERRQYAVRWLLICTGLLAGLLWIIAFFPLTIVRLQEKDAVLVIILLPFFIAGLASVLVSFFAIERWQNILRRMVLCGMLVLLAVTIAAVIPAVQSCIIELLEAVPLAADAMRRYSRLVVYNGPFYFLFSVAGLCALFAGRANPVLRSGVSRAVCAGLAAVCAVLLLNPGIAPFYPWALRRYIVFAIPLLCIGQSSALFAVVKLRGNGVKGRIVSVLLLIVAGGAIYNGVAISQKAMRASDYVGMAELINKFEGIAGDGDIVVADDARWATPLLLVSGGDVVDGSLIWQSADPQVRRRGIETLLDYGMRSRRRVVWLTSTEEGLSIYRDGRLSGAGKQIEQDIDIEFQNVIHSYRAEVFQNSSHQRTFRFYVADEGRGHGDLIRP